MSIELFMDNIIKGPSRNSLEDLNESNINDLTVSLCNLFMGMGDSKTLDLVPLVILIQKFSKYTESGAIFLEILGEDSSESNILDAFIFSYLASLLEVITAKGKAKEFLKESDHWKELLEIVAKEELSKNP